MHIVKLAAAAAGCVVLASATTAAVHAGPPPPIYIAAGYTGTGTPTAGINVAVTATSTNALALKNTVTGVTISCPAGVKFFGSTTTGPTQSSTGFISFTSSTWPACTSGAPVTLAHGAVTTTGSSYDTSWPLTATAVTVPNSTSPYPQLNQTTATLLGNPTAFGARAQTASGCRFSIVGSMYAYYTNASTSTGAITINGPATSGSPAGSLTVADQTQTPCSGGQFANGNALAFSTPPHFAVTAVNTSTGAAVNPLWVRV